MRGSSNTTGVKESSGFVLIPKDEYLFEIIEIGEKETASKDPMAAITLKVIGGDYDGRLVWDNIVIPNAGSPAIKIMGRTKHFWHCLGEPYEGDVQWDTSRWLFKKVRAVVGHEEVTQGKYAGKTKAVISNYVLADEIVKAENDPFGADPAEVWKE